MQTLKKSMFVLASLLFVMAEMPAAHADSQTFNVLFFKPATGRNPYLMLQSTDTLHQLQFEIDEYISYGRRPLEVRNAGARVQGVVDNTVVSDFVGAIGILDWLQFGFDVPFAFVNQYRSPDAAPTVPMKNEMGLSDIRLEFKARVLGCCSYPVGLAVVPFMSIPTGRDSVFLGDPGIGGGVRIALDASLTNRFRFTFNTGYQGGKKVNIRNVEFQHRLLLGAGLNAFIKQGLAVFGEVNADSDFSNFFSKRQANPAEVMAGLKWEVKNSGVTVSAAAGSCLVCGVKGALPRAVVGAGYRFNSPKYQQMDQTSKQSCVLNYAGKYTPYAIYELQSKCPPDPADFQKGVDDEACPKYYELAEVAELMMHCPPKPEDFVEGVHDDACNKVYTLSEKFSEKEIQNVYTLMTSELGTRCPPSPDEFNPNLHDEGCPKYYDLMEVSNLSAVCPKEMREYKPGEDNADCPTYYSLRDNYSEDQLALIAKLSKKDSDKDGINDYLDQCPKDPEDMEGFADEDGCPDSGISAVSGGEIRTFRPVYFAFNSTYLEYDSKQALDQVIDIINRMPWIRKVLVGGHADERGTDAANEKISYKRSNAVIEYMLKHGVRGNVILTPVGYGARKPVATGKTELDYAKNRRVVFTIATQRFVPGNGDGIHI